MLVTTNVPAWLQFVVRPQARQAPVAVRRAVLATIAYFDVQDMAVTGWEVYRWLWRGELAETPGLAAVHAALGELVATEELVCCEGMYCRRGREAVITVRKERQAFAARKWRKARRIAKLLAIIPYVRFVAVSNSLAWDNVREDSDLDFFLVAERGRIWLARGCATAVVAVLRRRPRLNHTRDTVCLNFWTVPGTPLRRVRLTEDIYLAYWLASLRPLYDEGGAGRRLQQANRWLDLSVPLPYSSRRRSDAVARLSQWFLAVKHGCEAAVPAAAEGLAERLQRAIMPRALRDKELEPSSHVLLDREMLKFHVNDRRAEIRDAWRRRLKEWQE